MEGKRIYASIDLKSFFASVECMERGLDPLDTNLVVADAARTQKTICLAVTPALKAYGIPGRARLFEVVERVKQVNAERKRRAPGKTFCGSSCSAKELQASPALAVDYITAPPRMSHYIAYSTRIYEIYLNYIAPEDIHVYSIDEVMIDLTDYLRLYRLTARELVRKMMQEVAEVTGITATAGIGSNLYLAKVAMDIVAKRIPPDVHGTRIAELDETGYRRLLWSHRPLTDFWRVGAGYAKKLEAHGLFTMGDIARCSVGAPDDYYNEALLYKLFGINAELLIDHAWGYEPCTMKAIKEYRTENHSICSGQVLTEPYRFEEALLVAKEMAELMALQLVDKGLMTDELVLTVGYDIDNLTDEKIRSVYRGEIVTDHYGRRIPKAAHGSRRLFSYTSSARQIREQTAALFEAIVDKRLLVRRFQLSAEHVRPKEALAKRDACTQIELFTGGDREAISNLKKMREEEKEAEREHRRQLAMLSIQKRYGKNAILKGMNLKEGATAMIRNQTIGGHKA